MLGHVWPYSAREIRHNRWCEDNVTPILSVWKLDNSPIFTCEKVRSQIWDAVPPLLFGDINNFVEKGWNIKMHLCVQVKYLALTPTHWQLFPLSSLLTRFLPNFTEEEWEDDVGGGGLPKSQSFQTWPWTTGGGWWPLDQSHHTPLSPLHLCTYIQTSLRI